VVKTCMTRSIKGHRLIWTLLRVRVLLDPGLGADMFEELHSVKYTAG
jgi:hypothetical protein